MTRQKGPPPSDEERKPPIDPYDPSRADKWGYTREEIFRVIPGLKALLPDAAQSADLNTLIIREYRWRRLAPELRQALGGKRAILGRQVLDVARDLCRRGAYDLTYDLYQALDGQPLIPYQGCGFGLMMNLKELMGERGSDPAGTILLSCPQGQDSIEREG